MINRKISSRRFPVIAAAAAASFAATAAFAQSEVKWDGTIGSYTNAVNWDPDQVPTNSSVQFLTIANGGTAQIIAGDVAEGQFLNLGMQPTENGRLESAAER